MIATAATNVTPTNEQLRALGLFDTGEPLVIEAGAGTGKTSTLKLLANSTRRRGQYLAFNKAIVVEAGEKMPSSVACSTAHSLAYRSVVTRNKKLAERLRRSARMPAHQIAKIIGVQDIDVSVKGGTPEKPTTTKKRLSSGFLAGLTVRALSRFCQSADDEPASRHVPRIDTIDPKGEYENNNHVAESLVPSMRRAWRDLTGDDGQLPFKHDHYLKIWQLSRPTINADFILFDECQDANNVLVSVVSRQNCQTIWVGDSCQAIYGFTGATNALDRIKEKGGNVAFLSKSFRFGEAIAEKANEILARIPKAELRLTGNERIQSSLGPIDNPRAILCRTNACAVRHFIDYLKDGKRPHLVGGGDDVVAFARAAQDLKAGRRTGHPDLACFESWDEVVAYVEEDEQGDELRLLVGLIDDFGAEEISSALSRMAKESEASVVLSTAHKSKGREWDTVRLADDFRPLAGASVDETRLMYVAVTRAKIRLDASSLDEKKREGDKA